MSHCGGSGWGVLMKKRDVLDYRFLAKTTSLDQLIPITYILFLTKLQKKTNPRKRFALLKNDIINNFDF